MKSIFIILSISLTLFFSGCASKRGISSPGYRTLTTTGVNRSSSTTRSTGAYTAVMHLKGDLSYLDRKYFRRTFDANLEKKGVSLEYNSPNSIDVRVTKSVLDTRTSGGASYQNCSAFKLDRKVTGTIEYIIRGKDTYANSINYKFLVKSASCISYDDAERKARLILIKRLGEITASKVAAKKSLLITNSAAGCAIR